MTKTESAVLAAFRFADRCASEDSQRSWEQFHPGEPMPEHWLHTFGSLKEASDFLRSSRAKVGERRFSEALASLTAKGIIERQSGGTVQTMYIQRREP